MNPIFYEVNVTLADVATARNWLDWMRSEHVADILAAGACSARIIRIDDASGSPAIIAAEGTTLGASAAVQFSVQYQFADRAAFDEYVRNHAPRLREKGMARFSPPTVQYARRSGTIEFHECC